MPFLSNKISSTALVLSEMKEVTQHIFFDIGDIRGINTNFINETVLFKMHLIQRPNFSSFITGEIENIIFEYTKRLKKSSCY